MNDYNEDDHITSSCVPSQKQINLEAEEAIKELEDVVEEETYSSPKEYQEINDLSDDEMEKLQDE